MNLLLDTHALIWWLTRSDKLSVRAAGAIEATTNRAFVSAASAWEIATKVRLGKMTLPARVFTSLDDLPESTGFLSLPVDWRHATLAGRWEAVHRDPFDRVLAAQARLERLTLVTIDPAFSAFRIRTLW